MKIGISSDHNGVKVKKNIIKYLKQLGHETVDFGTDSTLSVDYPEYAFKVGKALGKEIEIGILICGTGIGMSIAANKVKGVRCALVHDVSEAKLAKMHNNANILALSSKMNMFRVKDILDAFINTNFSEIERHKRRIDMIDNYNDN